MVSCLLTVTVLAPSVRRATSHLLVISKVVPNTLRRIKSAMISRRDETAHTHTHGGGTVVALPDSGKKRKNLRVVERCLAKRKEEGRRRRGARAKIDFTGTVVQLHGNEIRHFTVQ